MSSGGAVTCPVTLYKYFGPDRTEILQERLIRYSPLGAFNDPFEGRPDVTALDTEQALQERWTAALRGETRDAYKKLPAKVRATTPYKTWERLLSQQMQKMKPTVLQQMQGLTSVVWNSIAARFDNHLGALCLSESPDILLMWSHYAGNHQGFVLAFDARHPHFHEARTPHDEMRHLRRVAYRESRPCGPLTELDGTDVLLVKSTHWEYEREWRIFRSLKDADRVLPGKPFPIHLFRFPSDALQEVILGARVSSYTGNVVRGALSTDKDLAHVRLRFAELDSSSYRVRIGEAPIKPG